MTDVVLHHLCTRRRQVEQVRTAVNAAAAGGEAARRIAAEAGREYVLQKEQPAEEAGGWRGQLVLPLFS
jgi:hypothetical protein